MERDKRYSNIPIPEGGVEDPATQPPLQKLSPSGKDSETIEMLEDIEQVFRQQRAVRRRTDLKVRVPPSTPCMSKEPETVQCFDTLLYNMTMKKPERQLDDKDKLLITFVGDSKVRQLYYERLKV